MTKQRKRGRPRKSSNIEIIESAMAIYWRDGLAGRSLNEMCRKLEIAKPGIYREFGGEEGLIAETLTLYGRSVGEIFSKITNSQKAFHSQLSDFVDKVFELHEGHPHGCLLMQARLNQRNIGAGPTQVLHEEDAKSFQNTSTWVKLALTKGDIPLNMSVETATHLILSQISWIHNGIDSGLSEAMVRDLSALSLMALSKPTKLH
jgi:TetR/AcrR family transcriptional regulator, copper-responsive repressor